MNIQLDQAAPIRAGEELAVDRLDAYLRDNLPAKGQPPLVVEQFSHGHSNLTYLLRLGSAEFVLRRPPFGNKVKSAHDMAREYRVLSGLSQIYAPAPKPLLYCTDESVLGAPFYVMERRHGIVLRKRMPANSLEPETTRRLGLALVDSLALLHSLDYKAAELGELGKPEGYVARQVGGWTKRYAEARTDDVPTLEGVSRWLGANIPAESGASLIHNDYKFDNLLLDPADLTHIVAVLDWEMATIGDPLMDLGSSLGYWVEATDSEGMRQQSLGPTLLPGSLTRREVLERYEEKSGRRLDNALFYYCYGLFKLAGIIQQIYARYVRGHTRDPRFARMNEFVTVLGQQAEHALETGKI